MSPHGIEVAQRSDAPAIVACSQVLKNFLDMQLGATVGIDRCRGVAFVIG